MSLSSCFRHSAKSIAKLKRLGITHILNTALGQDKSHVDSTLETYKDIGAEFKGIEVTDHNSFQLKPFFEESAEFIDKALRSGGKKNMWIIFGNYVYFHN